MKVDGKNDAENENEREKVCAGEKKNENICHGYTYLFR